MGTIKVQCCDCDEYVYLEDACKIKVNGLTQNFYLCKGCLESVPLMQDLVEVPDAKKLFIVK